jgi:thiol-disulfide isomerase/thioredoxin
VGTKSIASRCRGLIGGAPAFVAILFTALAGSAFAFDLTDVAGKRHRLADYKGRWVVVNYWATWCVPCIQEIPEIAAFQKANPNVVVIGIAVDVDDVEKTKAFARKVGHEYALVLSDEKVEKQFKAVKGLPTTRIYDPAGRMTYDRLGRVTRRSLEEEVRKPTPTTARAAP